jgi:hypothetical protein
VPLTIDNRLTTWRLAAGEPFLFDLMLLNRDGMPVDISSRAYVMSFFKANSRTIIQQINGVERMEGIERFVRFARDGTFSEGFRGQVGIRVELSERFRNGRNVIAAGALTVDDSAFGLSSFDNGVLGHMAARARIREPNEISISSVPFVENLPGPEPEPDPDPEPVPAPQFTTDPSVTPTSGEVGDTFEVDPGEASNATALNVSWLRGGTAIATGTVYTADVAGDLTPRVVAVGPGGSTPFNLPVISVAEAPPAGPVSSISSLSVVDATPLDPSTTADAGNGIGINGEGWIARIELPYVVGATFDPSKLIVNAIDPGYDADCQPTTRMRTLRGTAEVRRQHPNQAQRLSYNGGPVATIYVGVEGSIYADTQLSATVEPGFYGAAAAGSIGTIVNGSVRPYPKPTGFAWLNLQHERATGATMRVEAVAFHRHMMLGQPIAGMRFTARDAGGGQSPTVRGQYQASQFQTRGAIADVFAADIALAALAQGEIAEVRAQVYPWIGNAAAVLDLDTDGIAWPTAQGTTKLRVLNDRLGTYGGAVACVRAGVAGGAVAADLASATASPFPTINAAIAALPAWNAANKGHNDHSGADVYLMDDGAGGAVAHVPAVNMGAIAAGLCWTRIRPHPANTGAVRVALDAVRTVPSLLRWEVDHAPTGSFYLDGSANNGNVMQAFTGMLITTISGTSPYAYRIGLNYCRNVIGSFAGAGQSLWGGSGTTRTQTAMLVGCSSVGAVAGNRAITPVTIGCANVNFAEPNRTTIPNLDANGSFCFYNNLCLSRSTSMVIGGGQGYPDGYAFVQNVLERAGGTTGVACLQIAADNNTLPVRNGVLAYNTIPGADDAARFNIDYTDEPGNVGVEKHSVELFNLWHKRNTKTDTFAVSTTVTGRVGNWRRRFGVDHIGNVIVDGASGGGVAADPGGGNWLGEALGPLSIGQGAVTFADFRAGVGGAGGGLYQPTGVANAAYNRVPAGRAGLARDIAGNVRRNDGTGAAGAYERAA